MSIVQPRKGKIIKIAPPAGEPIRAPIEAAVSFVTPEWVDAEVKRETWRFRAGTHLLLRRSSLLSLGRQLFAPDGAIVCIYPPESLSQVFAARAMDQLLARGCPTDELAADKGKDDG